MNVTAEMTSATEMVTFYVQGLLLGIPIRQVREINRNVELTRVPQAPEFVRGVVNLRGDVATVIDLSRVLGMGSSVISDASRNVVIQSDEHLNGLLVDQVADIVSVPDHMITSPPANVQGIEGRFFRGVYALDRELVVILDLAEILSE
jgi:purine-binding chemotaxis protein CheW